MGRRLSLRKPFTCFLAQPPRLIVEISPLSRLCGRGVGGEGSCFLSQPKTLTPNSSPAKPGEGDQNYSPNATTSVSNPEPAPPRGHFNAPSRHVRPPRLSPDRGRRRG